MVNIQIVLGGCVNSPESQPFMTELRILPRAGVTWHMRLASGKDSITTNIPNRYFATTLDIFLPESDKCVDKCLDFLTPFDGLGT